MLVWADKKEMVKVFAGPTIGSDVLLEEVLRNVRRGAAGLKRHRVCKDIGRFRITAGLRPIMIGFLGSSSDTVV